MSDKPDPLEGANIGETREINETQILHAVNFAHPVDVYGSDRDGDLDITDVELVENEEGYHDIRLTWEGEVTKQLPRNWDKHEEPVTDAEIRQARWETWGERIATAVATIVPLAVAGWFATWLANQIGGEVVINGDRLPTLDPVLIVSATVFTGVFILALKYAPVMARRGVRQR